MANRTFTEKRMSLEKPLVDLFCRITFGSTGAPTLVAADSKGVSAVSRTSAGLYVITLQDTYLKTLMISHVFKNATAPAAPGMFLVTDAVATLGAPKITVTFNIAGTSTDPASGEEVRLQFTLRNSTAI